MIKGKIKTSILFLFAMFAMLTVISMATALPVVEYVKINGDVYVDGESLAIEKGEDIDIKIKLLANGTNESNVEIEADIIGYEYNDKDELSDSTHTFDMDAGDTEYKTLSVSVPVKAEKDYYDLRVRVASRTGTSYEQLVRLNVKGVRHQLQIKDVLLHPANGVKSGSSLLVTARITNRGEKDEEDVKVTARIPELNLEDSYYIEEIEEDESKTSEELFLRIPSCTAEGMYELEVEVEFDEGEDVITQTEIFNVMTGDYCDANVDVDVKSIISVGSQVQQMTEGQSGATYSLAITNPGNDAKTYTLAVSGVDAWGTYRVDPSTTVLVEGGETKPVFIFVSANKDASEGQKPFVVSVASGSDSQSVQYYANVLKEDGTSLNDVAKYVLIALIIVLIVIGLIIGFSRMRGKDEDLDDDEELSGQTYY